MTHRQKELEAIQATEKPNPEVIENWARQFERLLDNARAQGDTGRVKRLRNYYAIMNRDEVSQSTR
tara:strand:+ start:3743 stop:3940 length:198 start_codon:yes stop_codon:yes gene_type:complete